MSELKFTIKQFKVYLQKQDSLGDAMYNLSDTNVVKANLYDDDDDDDVFNLEDEDDEVIYADDPRFESSLIAEELEDQDDWLRDDDDL